MAAKVEHSVFDGTTGRSEHGGKRTHIIQILRDTKEPLSVNDVAQKVGVHVSTARFHLESLVDAGLAIRKTQGRDTPGRPWVGYLGTLPNQTHERAHGYLLLSEILTNTIAETEQSANWLYEAGKKWGRSMATSSSPAQSVDEAEVCRQLIDKLDALWFAPELTPEDTPKLLLHNCPFFDAVQRHHSAVCKMHAGMINGCLEEMCSGLRLTTLHPQIDHHLCRGEFSQTTAAEINVQVKSHEE